MFSPVGTSILVSIAFFVKSSNASSIFSLLIELATILKKNPLSLTKSFSSFLSQKSSNFLSISRYKYIKPIFLLTNPNDITILFYSTVSSSFFVLLDTQPIIENIFISSSVASTISNFCLYSLGVINHFSLSFIHSSLSLYIFLNSAFFSFI